MIEKLSQWLRQGRTREVGDVEEVIPSKTEKTDEMQSEQNIMYSAVFSIQGMSCASCVGTIRTGLESLDFVRSVNINLIAFCGEIICTGPEGNVEKINEAIDDLGYDPTLLSVRRQDGDQQSSQQRTIQIHIHGLKSNDQLVQLAEGIEKSKSSTNLSRSSTSSLTADGDVSVVKQPTLSDPRITITYTPSPPSLTVRQLIAIINEAGDGISASVYHPPTQEEQRRKSIRKKFRSYLFRFLVAAMIVIPTFIIGVAFMDLVSEQSSSKRWFDKPIVGNSTRIEWALWVLTTPVMFYSASIFHYNAFKSIKSDWGRKSRTPILRRFYHFGNMDLLISAGTAVAYFSSLAILIMDATSNPEDHSMDSSSGTYFDTVTFLCFFIILGRLLETYTKGKTGDAVARLSDLRPAQAALIESQNEEIADLQNQSYRKIPADQLDVGDVVRVAHGESPPADGVICQDGEYLFNENMLTGESLPAKKQKGDTVFAGTINVSDPVSLFVTKVGGTSMLDQIVEAVQDGQAKRAHVDTVAETVTAYFVPIITLLAILTWVIWLGLGLSGALPQAWQDAPKGGWAFWSLEFAIAVFVVACPCGIGLAAPTAISVGSGMAAKLGILVRGGGIAFEEASKLETIVFDKTGTLTEGHMTVTNFELLNQNKESLNQDLILTLARILEESSTHPIAKAIAEYCANLGSSVKVETSEIKEISGQGMRGIFQVPRDTDKRVEVVLGNERILQSQIDGNDTLTSSNPNVVEKDSDFFLVQTLQKFQTLGFSTAILAIREVSNNNTSSNGVQQPFKPAAIFAVADPIKSEAAEVLQALRSNGIAVHMCTGDNPRTAFAIASQLNIPPENVRAGVLPKDKASYVYELQHPSHTTDPTSKDGKARVVGFVGDGTNDAPALTAAHISIALASGSNIAAVASSFVLLNSNLHTILALIKLAKRVFLRVKLNFAWAAVYNLCLVPVAAGVFFAIGATNEHPGFRLSPVWASLAMAASSISVVLSSLALRLPEISFDRWKARK